MESRPLTVREWGALSAGLSRALASAGVEPRIVSKAHPAARIAALWRRERPIMARGDRVFWPGAAADLADGPAMATLQHELQHLLDYATGRLTAARYLADPREWRYGYDLATVRAFDALGAEQRASMAEHLWLAERGLRPAAELAQLRRIIPWARGGTHADSAGAWR